MINFSVVIPLFNKSGQIVRALDSIKYQVYRQFEVIIVDDGSTDNSLKVAEAWIGALSEKDQSRYRIIVQENSGVSAARNNGIINSNYEYIALLDADDYWEAGHLMQFCRLIDNFYRDVDMFSNGSKYYCQDRFSYPKLSGYERWFGLVDYFNVSLISHGFINSSSVCVKKQALVDNPFPIDMSNFEDVITWARIANSKGFAFDSSRTAVVVLDDVAASINVEFSNYIKYENLLLKIKLDKKLLVLFEIKFLLFSIFFARIQMSFSQYLNSFLLVFTKSYTVSFCLLLGLFVPRFILNRLRDLRKSK